MRCTSVVVVVTLFMVVWWWCSWLTVGVRWGFWCGHCVVVVVIICCGDGNKHLCSSWLLVAYWCHIKCHFKIIIIFIKCNTQYKHTPEQTKTPTKTQTKHTQTSFLIAFFLSGRLNTILWILPSTIDNKSPSTPEDGDDEDEDGVSTAANSLMRLV